MERARLKFLIIFAAVLLTYIVLSHWLFPSVPIGPAASTNGPRLTPPPPPVEDVGTPIRVLLLGNSYANGIDDPLIRMFAADPQWAIELTAFTSGGARLIDHLDSPDVQRALSDEAWDAVILQEQSQTPSAARLNFVAHGDDHTPRAAATWFEQQTEGADVNKRDRRFSEIHKVYWKGAAGLAAARPAGVQHVMMLSTWPRHPDEWRGPDPFLGLFKAMGATDGESASALMLEANNGAAEAWAVQSDRGEVIRIGDAWQRAREEHPDINLYRGDHSHGSPAGYYLAAAVLYRALTGTPAASIQDDAGLASDEAQALRAVADTVFDSAPNP